VLRGWSAALRARKPDAYTVGEVWDSTGAMLPYYPDQLTSHFAFELADGIVNAVREGTAAKLLAPVLRLQRDVPEQRWSPFLRNHDQARTRTELGGDLRKARLASGIMLTMPGMPFVYYGEEIGMTGNKPDERLRTPMQWTRGKHGGFTTGTPWEALQPDSQAVNVATQAADGRSILTLHRRLIHLRAANSALGAGELVPLATTSDRVAAYARRDGDRVVLVVANLGKTPVNGVTISSTDRLLPTGRHAMRSLPAGTVASPLVAGADGRVARWVPVRTLAPLEIYLFEPTVTSAAGARR
jgi:alpha-amylase